MIVHITIWSSSVGRDRNGVYRNLFIRLENVSQGATLEYEHVESTIE